MAFIRCLALCVLLAVIEKNLADPCNGGEDVCSCSPAVVRPPIPKELPRVGKKILKKFNVLKEKHMGMLPHCSCHQIIVPGSLLPKTECFCQTENEAKQIIEPEVSRFSGDDLEQRIPDYHSIPSLHSQFQAVFSKFPTISSATSFNLLGHHRIFKRSNPIDDSNQRRPYSNYRRDRLNQVDRKPNQEKHLHYQSALEKFLDGWLSKSNDPEKEVFPVDAVSKMLGLRKAKKVDIGGREGVLDFGQTGVLTDGVVLKPPSNVKEGGLENYKGQILGLKTATRGQVYETNSGSRKLPFTKKRIMSYADLGYEPVASAESTESFRLPNYRGKRKLSGESDTTGVYEDEIPAHYKHFLNVLKRIQGQGNLGSHSEEV